MIVVKHGSPKHQNTKIQTYRQTRGLGANLGDLARGAKLAGELGLEAGQAVRALRQWRAPVDGQERMSTDDEWVSLVVADGVLVARVLLGELQHLSCLGHHVC